MSTDTETCDHDPADEPGFRRGYHRAPRLTLAIDGPPAVRLMEISDRARDRGLPLTGGQIGAMLLTLSFELGELAPQLLRTVSDAAPRLVPILLYLREILAQRDAAPAPEPTPPPGAHLPHVGVDELSAEQLECLAAAIERSRARRNAEAPRPPPPEPPPPESPHEPVRRNANPRTPRA